MEKIKIKKRKIDQEVEGVYFWLGKTFVLIKKTEIKTWQGVFIIAFFAGVIAAMIWSVSINIQSRSLAVVETASLKVTPSNVSVAQGENFSVDVIMNTGGNKVVAVNAIVTYDTRDFTLIDWNTSNSIFSSDNGCVYNSKPCEIIKNDSANGKISVILAKPTPGVNVSAGKIATLNFKATNNAQTDNIYITFEGVGKYTDSDVIMDGMGASGAGTDILASVANANIQISVPVVACTSFTYSEWSSCENNIQSRVVTSSSPAGCTGGDPVLSQSCQITCTEFTYSEWGVCQKNKTQTRTVLSSLPSGCTGGTPVLKQSCVVIKTPNTPPAKGKNK